MLWQAKLTLAISLMSIQLFLTCTIHYWQTCSLITYSCLLYKHAPLKTVSNRKLEQFSKPWITSGLRKSIKIKNSLLRVGQGGSGIPVYPKKVAKIPKNTQNSSKYTQNYTQVYFIPEIQRKWYTEYPYLSCNIPYTRFKKPLYTVYPKTLADPVSSNRVIS